MEKSKVLYTSDEAAKFVTNISGWVDRHGHFYGKDENAARYAGCTHIVCQDCGKPTRKGYLICSDCREKKAIERYKRREKKEWDGKTMLYSDATNDYFQDKDAVEEYIDENGCTLESLRLFLCEQVQLRTIEEDYWCDDLPDDGELPQEVLSALKELNDAIMDAEPVSWEPGDFAALL